MSGSIVVLMFSQLKLILEVIGPQPLEDNVETRMLIRVNKKNSSDRLKKKIVLQSSYINRK